MTEHTKGGKPRFQIDDTQERPRERAIVLVPVLSAPQDHKSQKRSDAARLEEAVGLAAAIDLEIAHQGLVPLGKLKPGTLFGTGKVEEIKGLIAALDVGLVVVDHPLTPVQQRNLETAWKAKVLDRTGLILEIFGARAQTKEGRLQVDLAHLNYQRGRLVRSWTHLERQRGGAGFLGGPGETQIEADRRQLQERIKGLERELDKVRRTRMLHRAKRKRVPHPVVALVGYTNAGKSTLFNRLTGADVMAKDMLFATLDPTLRRLTLPNGTLVILSDTVGFVSDLPTDLVAAFRATLEEVVEADLIVHVRDVHDPDTKAQAEDVYAVLERLGIADNGREGVLEVWNKIDLIDADHLTTMRMARENEEGPLFVSAQTGEGVDALLAAIEEQIAGKARVREVLIGVDAMGQLDWIYRNAQVVDRIDNEDGSVSLSLRAGDAVQAQIEQRIANF